MEPDKENFLKDAQILMHLIRYEITEYLNDHPNGKHIQKISDKLGRDRRVISYHLLKLEGNGFVKGNYEVSMQAPSKGKAIKRYILTDKTGETKTRIGELLDSLQLVTALLKKSEFFKTL